MAMQSKRVSVVSFEVNSHWSNVCCCAVQEKEALKEQAKVSHRDKIDVSVWLDVSSVYCNSFDPHSAQKLNEKLEALPIHNDVPKVAAAGLG